MSPIEEFVKADTVVCGTPLTVCSPFIFLLLPEVSHGGVTGSITMWHETLKRQCAGVQGRWTSTPGTIRNSMRQNISALPPMSTALRTPIRSDYDYTVRGCKRSVCLYPPLTHHWQQMHNDLSVRSDKWTFSEKYNHPVWINFYWQETWSFLVGLIFAFGEICW